MTPSNNKSVLIIGCSDAKGNQAAPAFDLYQGTMFKLINANMANVHDFFEVLILSAKHGLIHSSQIIKPYDQRMAKRTNAGEISQFVKDHKNSTYKLLEQYATKDRNLHIVLSNDYLAAIDEMFEAPRFKKLIKAFNSSYISRKHSGIGVLRGRLKKILKTAESKSEPTLFRSGLANEDEFIGYSHANASLGASLAYVSDIKKVNLFEYMIQSMESGKRAFLDNGVITELGKGKFVSPASVFERYSNIVRHLKPRVAKRLSIVIPDNPFDRAESVAIVRNNRKAIKWLASRCDVILPVHLAPDIAEHAHDLMKELNYIGGIRLGVPCKDAIKTDTGSVPVRLSLTDIETLFEQKNPKGNPLFSAVHYLALSEVSRGNIYQERKLLAEIHAMDFSCDACRSAAVMGNEKESNRSGAVMLRQVHEEFTHDNTIKSPEFESHKLEQEYEEPVAFTSAADAIEENVTVFVQHWNSTMGAAWELDIDGMDEEAAKEYCTEILCSFPRVIEDQLLEGLKQSYWQQFSHKHHEPTSFDKRTETFSRLFADGQRKPVQTSLPF